MGSRASVHSPLVSYRLIYIGLGALVVAVVALGFVFAPTGEDTELPAPFEAVFPEPNSSVIRQTTIDVDLEFGYEAQIFVDGFALPPSEVNYVDATGVYRWSPRPDSAVMQDWQPGEHTVRVEWERIVDAPITGSYEWTFRVQ